MLFVISLQLLAIGLHLADIVKALETIASKL